MAQTRRDLLGAGAGVIAAAWLPRRARAADLTGDSYDGGAIVVHPIEHASLVLQLPGLVVYVDPVGGAEAHAGLPPAGLVLVTHHHPDHFDLPTLAALVGPETRLVTNPTVRDRLPDQLKARAAALANGGEQTVGAVGIAAVPAYNLTADRLQYHPRGRDNGYVLTAAERRIYIAGDTEDTPEMRALTGIAIAFVPMNLPYTMSVEQAAAGVAAFAPTVVYPYHYGDSDLDAFERLLTATGAATKVVRGAWYP